MSQNAMLGESYTFYANLSYQTTKSCHKIATVLLISIAKEYLQVKKKKKSELLYMNVHEND